MSFLLALLITCWIYYQGTHRIGDIAFNKNIDDSKFEVCNEDRIFQYYSVGTNYSNGEKEIKRQFSELMSNLTFKNSGFITFRFVVNCNGEIGRFRVKTVDTELKENHFEERNIRHIEEKIKKLKKWNPGSRKKQNFDSYYVLTFKIEDGKINDIF
ncbi:hypothetical protein [Aquimarina sp. AU474]|uniref:hypothetical protein n=1 Tax=Aquimarina sp. AU474 TaxID=2108529 RepID=UPI000D694E5C|nr:hypothetical protein [Aquimarina sp. AU474]